MAKKPKSSMKVDRQAVICWYQTGTLFQTTPKDGQKNIYFGKLSVMETVVSKNF